MHVKKVNKKNLEFITKQLQPEEEIKLKKKTNTYIFYDKKINAVIEQEKKKIQRIKIKKYDPSFSTTQILPIIRRTKYLELPKENNLEEVMQAISYKKIKEENNYERYKRKTETIGLWNLFKTLKQYNVKEQFKNYFELWRDEPEFKFYEILNIISSTSAGALMGAVIPSFWNYGGVLKLAGVLAAIQKIGTPLTNVLSSGSMGTLVDKATGTTDIKDLKNLQKKVGALHTFITADTFLMQPSIIQLTPSPEATLLTLYALQTLGMTAGKMSLESKSFFAIRDYLIRKNPELENEEHRKKFYQIIGTGQSISSLCYAISFTSSWTISTINPILIPLIATISGATLITSKFLWGFQRKLKNPVTIKAKDYIEKENNYIFDTGWTIKPKHETELEQKLGGYQLPLKEELTIKAEEKIKTNEKKYCLEFITEKSKIKIKTKEEYQVNKISEKEYSVKIV